MGGKDIQYKKLAQPASRENITNPPTHRHRYRRRWFWLLLLVAFLLVAVPTAFAAAPTSPLYPIQRMGENLTTNLAPTQKDFFRAVFAARRIREAKYLIERLGKKPVQEQARDTQKIIQLLQEYRFGFEQITSDLGHQVDNGHRPSKNLFTAIEKASIQIYLDISGQRLEAPAAAQADVLRALETAHDGLALIADVLKHPPVSAEDARQLTVYVAAGLISKEDLTKLMSGVTSNRQFLEELRNKVKLGLLPASVLPAMEYDLVAQYAPEQLEHFQATVNFDEMRKIALLVKALTPTASEKKKIQAALAGYIPGQAVDPGSDANYVRPILYGLYLAQHLPKDLQNLDVDELQVGRRLFYETWKPLIQTKTTDPKELYEESISLVDRHIARNTDLLEQIEYEVLNALRSEVAYMALPPGWTQEQAVAIRPAFEQLIKDVKAATELQQQAATTIKDLAATTTPLAAPLANAELDQLRQETRQKLAAIQKQLAAVSASTDIPNGTMETIQQGMAAMKEDVDASIQIIVTKATAPTEALTLQVKELQDALAEALAAGNQAIDDVEAQVALNASLQEQLETTVAALTTANDNNQAELERRLASLEITAGIASANLKNDIDGIIANADKNTAALAAQLNDALKAQAELKISLSESVLAQADQAAELKAQLNLSESARLALKEEVAAAISTIQADQGEVVAKLEQTIAGNQALQSRVTAAITADIAAIRSGQTQMAASLQAQADQQDVLKIQVEASLAELKVATKNLSDDVATLKPSQADLKTFVDNLKADVDASAAAVQANAAETAKLRSDLEQSIAGIQASQAQATAELAGGLESLGQELRQSISDVQQAQAATAVGLATLGTTVDQTKAGIADIAATQVSTSATLQVHGTAMNDLRGELQQSLNQLQEAQTQTQSELKAVKSDVASLWQSVSDVQAVQAVANAKIDQLLAASVNWTQIPSSVTIDQNSLDDLKADLDAEFTAKSEALEAQYQQYHQQLDNDLNKLKSETDAQILRLQEEADKLKQQIQQLQQTTTPTTTTTTTNTSTGVGL